MSEKEEGRMEEKIKDLPIKCAQCGNKIQYGQIYHTHPVHGVVCEYCPAFGDGGIQMEIQED